MNKIDVKIKNLNPGENSLTRFPEAMSQWAAGMDIYAANSEDILIKPGKIGLIPTGFAIAVPHGYEAQIRPRSGLALKKGIIIPNSPGTIDSDYRGEVKIILGNFSEEEFLVKAGDRIAQMVICPVMSVNWIDSELLDETERNDGGFGHSGV